MKSQTLKRSMVSKLAELGVTLTPDGPVDRGVTQVAEVGARVVNESRRTVRTVRKDMEAAAEAARAAVHEATKPKEKSGRS
jgi:hypothetical protein